MAKKNISARVPPKIADSVDEYAEAWGMNRTDTLTAILENVVDGLPEPEQMEGAGEPDPLKYAYTLELTPENAEYVDEGETPAAEGINRVLRFYRR
jgi:hypothetical protein